MNNTGGTDSSDHEMPMRPSCGLPCIATVLALLGAHLFFTAIFVAALALSSMLATIAIWTYVTVVPFILFAAIPFASMLEEMHWMRMPAMICTALAPFITWYCRTAGRNTYFAVCLLLLCVSVVWLLQSINRCLETVSKEWPDGGSGTIRQAVRLSYKSVIYFVIAPLCADLVGIVYRSREFEHVFIYIMDNVTAAVPLPMAFLHYGGLVVALLVEAAIAVAMAYYLIRRNDDRTDNGTGLLE